MYPSTAISYELAQARITDLRHQARRASVARAAQAELQDGGSVVGYTSGTTCPSHRRGGSLYEAATSAIENL
jgi:hypothetical protein